MKRLYVIPLGIVEVDVSKFMAWEPERGERYAGPVAAFLIQTDDGKNVLVDTGLSPDHIEDPECRLPQPDVVVEMTQEDDIRHQLGLIGVKPEDVDIVVITHFDSTTRAETGSSRTPSSSSNGSSTNSRRRRRSAASGGTGTCRAELPADRRRPGAAAGNRARHDAGSAPGHQSVIVRGLPNTGTVILSSDAAHSQSSSRRSAVTRPRTPRRPTR